MTNDEKKFVIFEEAREFARSLHLKPTSKAWAEYCKNNILPEEIPIQPDQRYYRAGWKNWKDFLMGAENRFLPFNEAREYVKNLGLKTTREWNNFATGKLESKIGYRPSNIPQDPEYRYRTEWKGMRYWLGLTEIDGWLPYKVALQLVQEKMNQTCLKGQLGFKKLRKSDDYPDGVPTDPLRVYGDICNMADWYCNTNLEEDK